MLTIKPFAAAIAAGVSVVHRMSPSPGNFDSIHQTPTTSTEPSPSHISADPSANDFEFERSISRQHHQLDQFLEHHSDAVTTPDAVATPPLPVTNNPYILLGIPLHSDFAAARKAYLHMCKVYHPDRVVGPDCTDQEKKDANWDFSRINSESSLVDLQHA